MESGAEKGFPQQAGAGSQGSPFCDSQLLKVSHRRWASEPSYRRTALQGSQAGVVVGSGQLCTLANRASISSPLAASELMWADRTACRGARRALEPGGPGTPTAHPLLRHGGLFRKLP